MQFHSFSMLYKRPYLSRPHGVSYTVKPDKLIVLKKLLKLITSKPILFVFVIFIMLNKLNICIFKVLVKN